MRLFMSVLALTILPFAAGEGRGRSPTKGVVPSRRS